MNDKKEEGVESIETLLERHASERRTSTRDGRDFTNAATTAEGEANLNSSPRRMSSANSLKMSTPTPRRSDDPPRGLADNLNSNVELGLPPAPTPRRGNSFFDVIGKKTRISKSASLRGANKKEDAGTEKKEEEAMIVMEDHDMPTIVPTPSTSVGSSTISKRASKNEPFADDNRSGSASCWNTSEPSSAHVDGASGSAPLSCTSASNTKRTSSAATAPPLISGGPFSSPTEETKEGQAPDSQPRKRSCSAVTFSRTKTMTTLFPPTRIKTNPTPKRKKSSPPSPISLRHGVAIEGTKTHPDTSKRERIATFIHSHPMQIFLTILLLLDVVLVIVELVLQTRVNCRLSIEEERCVEPPLGAFPLITETIVNESGFYAPTGCGVFGEVKTPHGVHKAEQVIMWFSRAILIIFVAENLTLIACLGRHFFSILYTIDFIIVTTSLVLSFVFDGNEELESETALITFLRCWRFARILHGFGVTVHHVDGGEEESEGEGEHERDAQPVGAVIKSEKGNNTCTDEDNTGRKETKDGDSSTVAAESSNDQRGEEDEVILSENVIDGGEREAKCEAEQQQQLFRQKDRELRVLRDQVATLERQHAELVEHCRRREATYTLRV